MLQVSLAAALRAHIDLSFQKVWQGTARTGQLS
jgi:hypothetical protein